MKKGLKKLFGIGGGESEALQSVECGEFTLDFYYDEEDVEKCKIKIRCGQQMEVVLNVAHEGYGFLMSCLQDQAKDAMEAYCGLLWECSHLLAVDSYFPKRIVKSWEKYMRGLEKLAAKAAEEVTDEQNEADEALMQEAVKVAEMAEDARAAYHNEVAGKLAEILEKEEKEKE